MDELSSKMKSMYQLSLKEAARSNVGYRLGCIATYGGKIIGRACNTSKFSKETCTCHAEVNVLDNLYNTYTRKCKRDKIIHIFRKTKLYISRLTRGGDSQNSAPCVQCIHKIRQYHIKKIIFCLDGKYYIMSPNEFTRCYTTEGQHYINNSLQRANRFLLQEDEYL